MQSANLLEQVNKIRTDNGLPALVSNKKLEASALKKAEDLCVNDYWSHDRPDGTSWHSIMPYQVSAENLAYGFGSEEGMLTGWLNSPSHAKNIYEKEFTDTGLVIIGCPSYQGLPFAHIAAQHFATKPPAFVGYSTTIIALTMVSILLYNLYRLTKRIAKSVEGKKLSWVR